MNALMPDIAMTAREATGVAVSAGVALLLALVVHFVLFALLERLTRLSAIESDGDVLQRLRQPARWSLVAVAFSIAAERNPDFASLWVPLARFLVPALLGWIAFAIVKALATVIDRRAESDSIDPVAARSRRTRVAILSRTAGAVIVVVTLALMLFSIPAVRSIGVTLMASAGLAGLAVGAAAQPALKSLIAGIQMALTEPTCTSDTCSAPPRLSQSASAASRSRNAARIGAIGWPGLIGIVTLPIRPPLARDQFWKVVSKNRIEGTMMRRSSPARRMT